MSAPHDAFKDDAAAYVLQILEPEEQRAFEAHLAECEICSAEVHSLRNTASALAFAAPQRTPPAALRTRVLQSLGVSRATGAVVPRLVPSAPPVPKRSAGLLWAVPMAASVLLAVGVTAYAMRLQIRIAELETRLEQTLLRATTADRVMADARRVSFESQAALAVLTAMDLARIDLAGQPEAPRASARALWSRSRGMVFTASNLPPLAAGQVYQLWVVTAAAPVSAGLLAPDPSGATTAFFPTPPDIAPPQAIAVTVEPAGGVPAPTGPRYLIGTPAGA